MVSFRYQCLKVNVDMLRVIQIGITFSDDDGNFPTETPCTWQFHFSFSLQSDMCAPAPPKSCIYLMQYMFTI
jgi:CCR4-NOT transcription complex subunit 7/8